MSGGDPGGVDIPVRVRGVAVASRRSTALPGRLGATYRASGQPYCPPPGVAGETEPGGSVDRTGWRPGGSGHHPGRRHGRRGRASGPPRVEPALPGAAKRPRSWPSPTGTSRRTGTPGGRVRIQLPGGRVQLLPADRRPACLFHRHAPREHLPCRWCGSTPRTSCPTGWPRRCRSPARGLATPAGSRSSGSHWTDSTPVPVFCAPCPRSP